MKGLLSQSYNWALSFIFKIQVEDASKTFPSANSLQDREMKFVLVRFVKKNSCSSATNERAVLFGQRFIIEFETQQQHWNTGQIRNLFSRSVRSHFPPNVGCPWQTGQTTFKLKENHSNRISANLIKVPSKKWEKIFLKTKENNGNGQSHSF